MPIEVPRALETMEIPEIVGTFRQAALNAIEAGFDGVEVQGANSHLIEEFLEDGTNQRTDAFGGSKENRIRFLLDIVKEITAAIGPDRVGVRLSPFGQYGGIHDSNPLELFTFVIQELDKRCIAYLHLIEAKGSEMGLTDELHEDAVNNAALFREMFHGPFLFRSRVHAGKCGAGHRTEPCGRGRVWSSLYRKSGSCKANQGEPAAECSRPLHFLRRRRARLHRL